MMKRFIDPTEQSKSKKFDLLVIGGGITGAAVAYDAASRGLQVALVEKNDFGGATSSATSKLIHGGLRYLANMELALVRESLRERKNLGNIAPNFVYPFPFMITTNNNKITATKPVIKMGMIAYDLLSFDKGWTWDKSKKIPWHKSLSKKKVLELESNVKEEGLTGAAVYYDSVSIFPERLTLAFIKSAVKHGAQVTNYCEVKDFLYDQNKKIKGIKGYDKINNKEIEIESTLTVNCGGPWADIILNLAKKENTDKQIRRSEGIHIITKKLADDHVIMSMTPSGRHFFIIPWRNHSLIGTTDKEYIGSPDEYQVTKKSINELLDEVNSSFGKNPLKYEDILHTYGGLRPLVEDQTENVYESSRKYEIYDNAQDGLDGLITVEGGKYTTSRNLAENVIKMVSKKLNKNLPACKTDKKFLYGCEIKDINDFINSALQENKEISSETIKYLTRHYGTEYKKVLELAQTDKKLLEPLNGDGEILAEVLYALKNEMAFSLNDLFFRRTGLGTLGDPGDEIINKVIDLAASELGWDQTKINSETTELKKKFIIPQ